MLANGMQIVYRLSQALGEASEGDEVRITIDKNAKDGMLIILFPKDKDADSAIDY